MAFFSPASKIERAVAQFLLLQGKADAATTFISNDVRKRKFPNRTILATGFSPTVYYRQGGVVYFGIQHHFSIVPQPLAEDMRSTMDAFVGATADSMTVSDGNSLAAVADAITVAGRQLAVSDGTEAGDVLSANNADMLNFRCDWLKVETPFLVRGKTDEKGDYWVEILNFSAFVSQATN